MENRKRGIAWGLSALLLVALAGCSSSRFRPVFIEDKTSAVEVGLRAADADVELEIVHLIIYRGPGSWKARANWDEYVCRLHNRGDESIFIHGVAVEDAAGEWIRFGIDPWLLEEATARRLQACEDDDWEVAKGVFSTTAVNSGLATVVLAESVVLGFGVGVGASSTVVGAGLAGPAVVGLSAAFDHTHRKQIEEEFAKRSLAFPIRLAPGESVTGSVFFPITPSPQRLRVSYFFPGEDPLLVHLDRALPELAGLHRRTESPAPEALDAVASAEERKPGAPRKGR